MCFAGSKKDYYLKYYYHLELDFKIIFAFSARLPNGFLDSMANTSVVSMWK